MPSSLHRTGEVGELHRPGCASRRAVATRISRIGPRSRHQRPLRRRPQLGAAEALGLAVILGVLAFILVSELSGGGPSSQLLEGPHLLPVSAIGPSGGPVASGGTTELAPPAPEAPGPLAAVTARARDVV